MKAISLAMTLVVIGVFFPAVLPKIGAVLSAFLDLALQVFEAGGRITAA